ncbi:hypothetical protein F4680DRAFT_97395 [Xylaria scruposa]|nr:hypothetical protein F4680DRAFT_97395 [Xylaria scruposa]
MDIIAETRTLDLFYAATRYAEGGYIGFELRLDEFALLIQVAEAGWVLSIRMPGTKIVLGKDVGNPVNVMLYQWGPKLSCKAGRWVRHGEIKAYPQALHSDGHEGLIECSSA